MEKTLIFISWLLLTIFWSNPISWYLFLPLIVYMWVYIKNSKFIYFSVILIPLVNFLGMGQVADKLAFLILLQLAGDLARSYVRSKC